MTEAGQPWVKESFGNWFTEVCRKAGCPGSAHGLRKAGATRAAERGATERQLMAIFGWASPRMAAIYTRTADRKRLAKDAARRCFCRHIQRTKRPHLPSPVRATAPMLGQNQEFKMRMVPLAGLEPAQCCHYLILSQARLPIPPQGLAGGI